MARWIQAVPAEKKHNPPGALLRPVRDGKEKPFVRVMDFTAEDLVEKEFQNGAELAPFAGTKRLSWIDVVGVHDPELLESVGKTFGLHPLLLEDAANTRQRPKFEDFGDKLFLVLKSLRYDAKRSAAALEHIAVVLMPGTVITFQQTRADVFDPLRQRIRSARGRIRKAGSDYLAYAVLDAVIDGYFECIEKIGDRIETLEERVLHDSRKSTLEEVLRLKREMIQLRKILWPLREAIGKFRSLESDWVAAETQAYVRDLYDHVLQLVESVDSYREMLSGLMDIYLSSLSNKMNEVMKVLTLFASIFIPLTFLAGIYGMNFEHIPELHYRWAYPTFWLITLATIGAMLAFFKRKDWI